MFRSLYSVYSLCVDVAVLLHQVSTHLQLNIYIISNVTSLLGNSKLYILNPYSFRQCAKIIMLPGCD